MKNGLLALVFGACGVVSTAQAALSVREAGDGTFDILRDGVPVVCNVRTTFGSPGPVKIEKAQLVAPDGSRVWERWSGEKEGRFRFELVERKDGAIEVSILGSGDATTKNRWRNIEFALPADVYAGKPWQGLLNSGTKPKDGSGAFGQPGKRTICFLATEGLVFDFSPFGVTEHAGTGHRAVAPITYFTFDAAGGAKARYTSNIVGTSGGCCGAKLVLREGVFADYDRLHPLKSFWYSQRMASSHLLKFGAPAAGNNELVHYVDGDVPFEKRYGWVGDVVREKHVGNPTGAWYSQVSGRGQATYRIAGIADGWHVVTLQLGNWSGVENRFSVRVNGAPLADDVSVGAKKARTISRCVRVRGGKIDFDFDGAWTLSGLGVQPRLYAAEDFTVDRGFWYVPGYEPAEMYRCETAARPPVIATLDETIDMPEPGRETAAKWREMPRETDCGSGDDGWVREQRMWKLPSCVGGEWDDADYREKLFAEQVAKHGYNSIMLNGMLSRHTFPDDTIKRAQERVFEITRLAKRHGLKVIDHMDTTLLWSKETGFRVMLARFPEVLRDRWSNLPDAFQFCPNNPTFKKTLFEYLKRDVEAGVDGFQLDEVEFCSGCTCRHCRERFKAETGWEIPLDETSPDLTPGARTPFALAWGLWKSRVVTDWHIELRKYLKKLKPDLYLSKYSTTSNFVKSRFAHDCLVDYARVMSSFGTEIMTANSIYDGRALLPLMKSKNVLTALSGAPVWNWFYDKTPYSNYFSWGLCALTGQIPLLNNVTNDGSAPDPVQWAKVSRPMKSEGAEELAEVALLFSSATRDRCPKSQHEEELIGLAQELDALHVPYNYVLDVGLTAEKLAKYKVLFLGDAQILDEPVRGEIAKYRAAGGRVYARPGVGDYAEQPSCAAFYAREVIPWMSRKYAFDPDLAAEAKVRRELAALVGDARLWAVRGADERVYATLWREKSGDVCVHFLNGRGGDAKPGDELFDTMVPKAPFPDQEEDIVFDLPCAGQTAVALGPDFFGERKLTVESLDGGRLRVTLPKELFKAYTLVRIK